MKADISDNLNLLAESIDGIADNLQAFVVQGALTRKNGAIAVVELIATHRLSEHHLKS